MGNGYNFGAGGPSWNGIPLVGGLPLIPGDWFFVDYGNGSDSYSTKSNSIKRPWKTMQKAYDAVTTNKGDGIGIVGDTAVALSEMLTVAKNRVTFVGVEGATRFYGQNARVDLGITGVATNLGTILNTGVRNAFLNIKFRNLDTVAQGLYCFLEGGEYTVIDRCEIYKETMLTTTGAAELVMNGDSVQVTNSTIGSLANAQTGTTIRPGVLMTKGIAGAGLVARDVLFDNVNFWKRAGHVNGRHIYGANATDVERIMVVRNSRFINAVNAAAVPDQCVGFAASLTVGQVLLDNCTSINNTKLSTTTGVFVQGAVPTGATSGIAVQGA